MAHLEKLWSLARAQAWNVFTLVILACGLTEGTWGILQIFNIVERHSDIYPATGSFYNPGPYGCLLACFLPMIFYGWLTAWSRWKKVLTFIFLLEAAFLIPGGLSRTAWLAGAAGCMVVAAGHYRARILAIPRRRLLAYLALICVALAAICLGAYLVKPDSADGRALMRKVAWEAAGLHGVGWDRVVGAYGLAQEQYFASGRGTASEAMVAGEPAFVFNEYLQIAIAYGLPAAICFTLALFGSAVQYARRRMFGLAGSTVAVMMVCMSSYPFQFMEFRLLTFALVVGAALTFSQHVLRWGMTGAACGIAMSLYLSYTPVENAFSRFRRAQQAYVDADYQQAVDILKSTMEVTSVPTSLTMIGRTFEKMQQPDSAEHYYIRAIHRVPNRMYPHYRLMKLYERTGNAALMRQEAEYIMSMPLKNNSTATEEMRREAAKRL